MASMEGKVAAITGAASGIGLATAKLLYSRGATLCLSDIAASNLTKAAETISAASPNSEAKITTTIVDVSHSKQINHWIDAIIAEHGKLDYACNIAGIAQPWVTLQETEDEVWDRVMGINGKGVFMCIRKELQVMKEGAAIVNVASVAGLSGTPWLGIYGAAKHAVVGLTKTAAKENGERGIRVNAVAPGVIVTPMTADFISHMKTVVDRSALKRPAEPEEVARAIVFLLSEEASFITGTVLNVDAGILA